LQEPLKLYLTDEMNIIFVAGIALVILGYGTDILVFDLLPRQWSKKWRTIGYLGNYAGMLGWFVTFYGAMSINILVGIVVLVVAYYLPSLADKIK
jgi:hypothetical protein